MDLARFRREVRPGGARAAHPRPHVGGDLRDLLACAAAVAVDLLLAAYPAPRRVALDALAYVTVALALRAVDVRAIVRFVASAMEARAGGCIP